MQYSTNDVRRVLWPKPFPEVTRRTQDAQGAQSVLSDLDRSGQQGMALEGEGGDSAVLVRIGEHERRPDPEDPAV